MTDENILPDFFRTLAESIENKNIPDDALERAREFYMSSKFFEIENNDNNTHEFTANEILKFIIMGWYIYFIKLNISPDTDNEPK